MTVITGTGSFIPADIKSNRDFTIHDFYDDTHERIPGAAADIVSKFEKVTGIYARRYANTDINASDMPPLRRTPPSAMRRSIPRPSTSSSWP